MVLLGQLRTNQDHVRPWLALCHQAVPRPHSRPLCNYMLWNHSWTPLGQNTFGNMVKYTPTLQTSFITICHSSSLFLQKRAKNHSKNRTTCQFEHFDIPTWAQSHCHWLSESFREFRPTSSKKLLPTSSYSLPQGLAEATLLLRSMRMVWARFGFQSANGGIVLMLRCVKMTLSREFLTDLPF